MPQVEATAGNYLSESGARLKTGIFLQKWSKIVPNLPLCDKNVTQMTKSIKGFDLKPVFRPVLAVNVVFLAHPDTKIPLRPEYSPASGLRETRKGVGMDVSCQRRYGAIPRDESFVIYCATQQSRFFGWRGVDTTNFRLFFEQIRPTQAIFPKSRYLRIRNLP
ncbi:hypothetical protein [Paraburkholderia guartelaensis]|uniref:hypothetical protein n=1 Tax=Paraburkholderia guartelaensis TaxID=2546446 RepID=UPI002AB73165|nr:hypothetical protein [Paraburkholderia guartelaensis]